MNGDPRIVASGEGWFVAEAEIDGAQTQPVHFSTRGVDVATVAVEDLATALSTGTLELKKAFTTRREGVWSFASAQELSAAGQLVDVDVHDAPLLVARMKTVQSAVKLRVLVYGRRTHRVQIDDADTRLVRAIDLAPGGYVRPAADLEQYDAALGSFLTMVDNRGYFCYLGRLSRAIASAQVQILIHTAATGGGTTGEAGLFSSASPPNGTAQTLTKLGSASITLTGTGSALSGAIAASVPAGTHLWAGVRGTGWATAPDVSQVSYDLGHARALYKSTVGAFSGLTSTSTSMQSAVAYGVVAYVSALLG